jgi:hypothetical protein
MNSKVYRHKETRSFIERYAEKDIKQSTHANKIMRKSKKKPKIVNCVESHFSTNAILDLDDLIPSFIP